MEVNRELSAHPVALARRRSFQTNRGADEALRFSFCSLKQSQETGKPAAGKTPHIWLPEPPHQACRTSRNFSTMLDVRAGGKVALRKHALV
jgi:hypothetical protein